MFFNSIRGKQNDFVTVTALRILVKDLLITKLEIAEFHNYIFFCNLGNFQGQE